MTDAVESVVSTDNNYDVKIVAGILRVIIVMVAVLLCAYLFVFGIVQKITYTSPEAWGQFGDYFGGLMNPAISICTLIIAIRVFSEQKKAINLQKEELQATREELKKTRETANKQAEIMRQQQKSQQFFDLMKIYEKTFQDANKEKNLEDFFIRDLKQYSRNHPYNSEVEGELGLDESKFYDNLFKKYFIKYENELFYAYKNYLQLIQSIFVDFFDYNNDQIYINLFISQLKRSELRLIALFMMRKNVQNEAFVYFVSQCTLFSELQKDSFREWAESELPPNFFAKA